MLRFMPVVGSRDFILSRTDAYIGVMVDDLITRGVSEPYRMFTSRAEYRLKLRADNADQRLTEIGEAYGCVGSERSMSYAEKKKALVEGESLLKTLSLTPTEAHDKGLKINRDGKRRSAYDLLAFPDIDLDVLRRVWPEINDIPPQIAEQLEVDARYVVYLKRQEEDIKAVQKDENIKIPADFDYRTISGLSNELCHKLETHKPATLGHASRIEGITPAALMLVLAHVRKATRRKIA